MFQCIFYKSHYTAGNILIRDVGLPVMGSSLHVYNQTSQGCFFWANPTKQGSLPRVSAWSKGDLKFTG